MDITAQRSTWLYVARVRYRLASFRAYAKRFRSGLGRCSFIKLRAGGRFVDSQAIATKTTGRLVEYFARVGSSFHRLHQRLLTNAGMRQSATPAPIASARLRNCMDFHA